MVFVRQTYDPVKDLFFAKKIPFTIAIQGNVELMHERCPKHLGMETEIRNRYRNGGIQQAEENKYGKQGEGHEIKNVLFISMLKYIE